MGKVCRLGKGQALQGRRHFKQAYHRKSKNIFWLKHDRFQIHKFLLFNLTAECFHHVKDNSICAVAKEITSCDKTENNLYSIIISHIQLLLLYNSHTTCPSLHLTYNHGWEHKNLKKPADSSDWRQKL